MRNASPRPPRRRATGPRRAWRPSRSVAARVLWHAYLPANAENLNVSLARDAIRVAHAGRAPGSWGSPSCLSARRTMPRRRRPASIHRPPRTGPSCWPSSSLLLARGMYERPGRPGDAVRGPAPPSIRPRPPRPLSPAHPPRPRPHRPRRARPSPVRSPVHGGCDARWRSMIARCSCPARSLPRRPYRIVASCPTEPCPSIEGPRPMPAGRSGPLTTTSPPAGTGTATSPRQRRSPMCLAATPPATRCRAGRAPRRPCACGWPPRSDRPAAPVETQALQGALSWP